MGTDLYFNPQQRIRNCASTKLASKVAKSNQSNDHTIICANAFDRDLIRDVQQRIQSQPPILLSYNALYALYDSKMNPWERKESEDRYEPKAVYNSNSPYVAHIHLVGHTGLWEEGTQKGAYHDRVFTWVKNDAIDNNWEICQLENGLLVLNPEFG